eukprot:45498_1
MDDQDTASSCRQSEDSDYSYDQICFKDFPEEIIFNQLQFLTAQDICRASCVSRQFHSVCGHRHLWKGLVERDFDLPFEEIDPAIKESSVVIDIKSSKSE